MDRRSSDTLDDDAPVGRVLTRREVLAFFGGTAAFLAACVAEPAPSTSPTATPTGPGGAAATPTAPGATAALPSCVVRPEQTEGPFFVDATLDRSDIRSDPGSGAVPDGVPLALAFAVLRVATASCAPLAGAVVDVWHCDAAGRYSDVAASATGSTLGQRFLRGHQVTDASGAARFVTIYPGWYPGRAVHIHFKIRTTESGQTYDFTSQLYFDDALTDEVHGRQPYAAAGSGRMRNDADGLYRGGGELLTLALAPDGDGYAATFDIGLQIG
ncbi:MAG TPA: intradiol ring-cleavage dioxygenase [Candidatus Limnocylindrales bacterium]|nr:intradiol ring-cleavage dioxygenase [Candidatus Limnocylindrales bacterium]